MPHKHPSRFSRLLMKRAAIVLGSMAVAFFVGVETAGDVHPIDSTNAVAFVKGDFSGNGILDLPDARRALRIVEGLSMPTEKELERDPTTDWRITEEDVMYILEHLSRR